MLLFNRTIFLAFAISFLAFACGKMEVPEGVTYEVLSPDDFEQKLAQLGDVHLIDARTPPELEKGHLPNVLNYDYRADEIKKAVKELDKNKPVLIYCGSGIRSQKAAEIMIGAGFTEIYDMEGGMKAWLAAGKEVE